MAGKEKVGRNDRCPCGSGKKYKNCCESKDASRMSATSWAAVLALVAAAAVLVFFVYNYTQGDSMTTGPACPPGTVWAHGHCHQL